MDRTEPPRRVGAHGAGVVGGRGHLRGHSRLESAAFLSPRLYALARHHRHRGLQQKGRRRHTGRAEPGAKPNAIRLRARPGAARTASSEVAKHARRTGRRADVGKTRPENRPRVPVLIRWRKDQDDSQGATGAVSGVPRGLHSARIVRPRRKGARRRVRLLRGTRIIGQIERQRRAGKSG